MSAVSELMPPEWDTTAMPGTPGLGVWARRCAVSRSSSESWTRITPYWAKIASYRASAPVTASACYEFCHFEKFIGLFEAVDKPSNYPSIRIVQQIAREIGKAEVCLVPC